MAEARKEETVAEKAAAAEGKTSVLRGTGGEETEDKMEKAPAEMTDW